MYFYAYDYLGRRVKKKAYNANGQLIENVESTYDGWRVVKEQDSVSQYLRLYVYGPGIDELVCMKRIFEDTSEDFYYQYDPLGSVVAISGSQSMVLERYSYDAYGKPTIYDADGDIISQSAYGNRFMFTGREYDYATGNYYYRNRDYKPSIGCFLQTDPIRYYGGLNLYTYCGNDPVNWIDPYGLLKRGGAFSKYGFAKRRINNEMNKELNPGKPGPGENLRKGDTERASEMIAEEMTGREFNELKNENNKQTQLEKINNITDRIQDKIDGRDGDPAIEGERDKDDPGYHPQEGDKDVADRVNEAKKKKDDECKGTGASTGGM